MKSFFDDRSYQELQARLELIIPDAPRQWGTMKVSQMLKHCQFPLEIALSKETTTLKPNWIAKLFFKKTLYSPKPYKKNLPTPKPLKVITEENFEIEKQRLSLLMEELWQDRINDKRRSHPVFGSFTKEQWGSMQWKHLNHHFKQFGV